MGENELATPTVPRVLKGVWFYKWGLEDEKLVAPET